MVEQKPRPAEDADLPVDRVEKVGDYFKNLFVRSLRLSLDDTDRLCPWDEPPEPGSDKRDKPSGEGTV